MKNILFLAFLISIFSCTDDKPNNKMNIPNAPPEDSINCDLNLELILGEYMSENESTDILGGDDPLLKLLPQYGVKFKGAIKKVRLSKYHYAKRFDEDHWDLTFDETTYYDKKKNPIKINRETSKTSWNPNRPKDSYTKEIFYDSLLNSNTILSLKIDQKTASGRANYSLDYRLTEIKNNYESTITNKNTWSSTDLRNSSDDIKRILNKDFSRPTSITKFKIYKDSLGKTIKKTVYAKKYNNWGNHYGKSERYDNDSVVIKHENRSDKYKIIRKYDQKGARTHVTKVYYYIEGNSLSINNSVGNDVSFLPYEISKNSNINFYFNDDCVLVKITSANVNKCLKIEFNEHSDILKRVSYKIPGKNNSSFPRYDENYEDLLTKDLDLMKLSEYNWSTYNNYKYDSIGSWTHRTRITNIVGYPGTLRIKEKREIEYY